MRAESELEEAESDEGGKQKGHCKVRLGDMEVQQVDEIKHLGVMISSDGSMEKEVEAKVGSAVRMSGGMSEAVLAVMEKGTKQEN